MEIRNVNKSSNISKSSGAKGESLSTLGTAAAFLLAVFRKKKRDKDKDNKFSKDEQIVAGVICSDELLKQVQNKTDKKTTNPHV
ncbi:MAG: hypothetical protein A2Y40_04130 [Candidatus Margulisbacteria bacterium GWF2_35_9]|nr:MAG: hypothetical protein A2Y40_04130 [Candidatus Margulisbacteria bacterium GWF2_35_9]